MGLPLFIAKTESDLPTKASGKDAVLAPANAGVQSARSRHRRVVPPSQAPSNEREARWRLEHTRGGRRFMRLIADENSRATAIPQVTLERIAALDTALDPIDQAMDEYLQLDFQQRRRWTGELQQLLGPRWTQDGLRARARIMALRNVRARSYVPSDLPSRAAESLGTWTAEPRPQARRARVVSPVSSETEPHPNALSPSELARLRQLIEGMQRHRRGLPRSNLLDDAPELSLREWTRLSNASRQSRMLDGLGDRQRSMSPEMWDTLLSTMTPDPEPPSVSTSFATAQSQDTAATSFSVPDELRDMEGFLSEPPCEYSDPEDEDPLGHAVPTETQRREGGPSEGPFTLRRAVSLTSARRNALRRRVEGRSDNEGPSDTGPGSQSRPVRDGWVGSLSVGAADDAATQPSRGTRRPAASRHSEDDWAGMQLIVQGLAQREDIPDEWWLEVGLSRTLGGDGDA